MAIHFTDESAREAIESGKPVVIDFWAEWCGPCLKLGPSVEELAEKYEGKAIVGKINVDENDEISTEFRVRNIPTVIFLKEGKLVDRTVGFVSFAELETKLQALL
ncbi:MAG: thioredoxin [Prevotella sp.]|nr:thioredoxin [Prevotella sp.]MCM1074739.1 thioredoxin [Ruminococcus sp.]